MAKPPKKLSVPTSPDSTSTTFSYEPELSTPSRINPGAAEPFVPFQDHATGTVAPDTLPSAPDRGPSVQVSERPDTVATLLERNLRAITWPADRIHLLRAADDGSGLFESPEGQHYAYVANEGYFLTERQAQGRYRIRWPAALGEAGPLLRRVDGQAQWRIEPVSTDSATLAPAAQAAQASALQLPRPLAPELAALLTEAHATPTGVRYDKRAGTYVDMEDGTTFLVRKRADGNYQQASAHQLHAYGDIVEQVPGTKRWRSRSADDATASGKRLRLDDASPSLDATEGQWRSWGKVGKPDWQESVPIGDRHYVIVPQAMPADVKFVYLENPAFTARRFDAFEQMLRNDPSLQPRWAVKDQHQWTVVETPTFSKPLTQQVAQSFVHVTEQSAGTIARALFNQVNHSEFINGEGLRMLFDTLYHWENRNSTVAPRRDLADPLMMLAVLPAQPGHHLLGHTLLLPSPADLLFSRIDFDTASFHQLWKEAVDTPGASIRSVFSAILEQNGYEVDRTSRVFAEDALLFRRKNLDSVFVLKMQNVALDGTVHRATDPGSELNDPALRAEIENSEWKRLLEPGKVIYLVGGVQQTTAERTTLFIVREG